MAGALIAVTSGELKHSEAIAKYGVPRQMLRDRLSGWVVHGTKPEPKPYLTKEDKEILMDHLIPADKPLGKQNHVLYISA